MLIPFGILSASATLVRISVAGYYAGGSTSSTVRVATVDKFAFPADTRTTLGTGLSATRTGLAGMSNSGVAGYSGAGIETARVTTVDKFAFPADTRTTLGTGLTTAVNALVGFANYGVAGYFGGGFSTVNESTVDKFSFPADTKTTLGTGLSAGRNSAAGMSNSGVAGYVGGGGEFGLGQVTTVDKFAFPSDSRSTLGTGLDVARRDLGAMANFGVAGYFAGGVFDLPSFAFVSSVDKFAFPSDTRSTLGAALSAGRRGHSGFSNSEVAGYFAGGLETTDLDTGNRTTVDKFAFPAETRTTLATGLSSARRNGAAFSNEGVL